MSRDSLAGSEELQSVSFEEVVKGQKKGSISIYTGRAPSHLGSSEENDCIRITQTVDVTR
jgi:hypothetical protein